MSAILFLGAKNPLHKTEFRPEEVFSDIKYKDSFFFHRGIEFAADMFEGNRQHLGKASSKCHWYEVKCNVMLFEFESKNKDILPDLYEASLQMSEWLLGFLSAQTKKGNELYLLQRWLGDPPDREISNKTWNIGSLKPIDQPIPCDTLIQLTLS